MKRYILTYILSIGVFSISFGQNCLNVDCKLRGYFYVGTSLVDTTAFGGFYEDQNIPKKLTLELENISEEEKFEIIVRTDSVAEFKEGIIGYKVFIINKTDSIVELPAQDSRLYIKRQVFYKGKWKDVEYLPSSWCGNSYHSVFIKPNEYWDLTAPCIEGKINAKFRFRLFAGEDKIFYSNEFEGSFNKKQLRKEQGHKPVGIMDSYNN